ncbi:PTS sugar transporter subunit IIB [Secundilactobacillus kimchicus]|uniref:PTS sugar transporter subunit IIB n=1 Tax=Secundilactobacillus kimchicus TaxID=528209 RepID=UPI0024A7D667|nr:PTS sugar transporter subunit IIB [Secundilactobacillus kimchicus]
MVGIVIASHGQFAEGIQQSGSMIFGEQQDVKAVTLKPSEGPDDFRAHVQEAVASLSDPEDVLFLVDLWGGTPFNQINNLLTDHKDKWAIVTGLNLPMLIEAYGARMGETTAHEIASHILEVAKDGVKVKPEELAPKQTASAASPAQAQPAATNGTVGKPGDMDYVLTRIDSRLLHGQVATAWTKSVSPNRIIVVSDAVAKDDLRKNLIQQAAPIGVKAHVVPVDHMIELAKDKEHFGGQRVLLLFENPEDILRAVEGGVPLKTINVGSMAHSVGKVQPNKVLAFDQTDVDTFKKLKEKGLQFDVRKVPGDGGENMDNILKKAESELQAQKT